MSFFDIFVAIAVAWMLGRWIGLVRENEKLEHELKEKITVLKENALKMKLEKHQDTWYAWRAIDDQFMGQAKSRSECLAEVARRIGLPDPNFLVVVEEK